MNKKSLSEWDICSRYIAPDIQRACWRIRKQVIQPGQVHAQLTEAQVRRAAA
ncbi:hypothetical protein [Pseudomonas aeruginosa]|uniref:hypothetical protein n=1 Tax=Pseudomonas aeruginosa TaxID=287 RepID=UPI000A8BB870|nr:hypothetical protein [Pseudomonas aeruginosa]EKN9355091.1 hypothetical protein [Pseudomonas aeruginosa]MBX6655254.1 hypothetical protein [Pseudomonas aeruginosa]MBX6819372.1 hypothetical protein [Pseudomonas aeruginosa]GLF13065.1 hypothetical protein VNPA131183_65340 [Pseudomonas aeruginosa]HBO1617270.1 hypothetical protein [Pseudomonas aeruginosa]